MAIPTWAVEALMRGVGSVVDKVPPERIDQIKQRAGQWLDELPQSAARSVDSVMRGARVGKEMLDRWARRHTALVTPVINASGSLVEPRIQGVPVGLGTVDLVAEALASPPLVTPVALARLHRRLNRCTGNHDLAILVANSVDAACLAIGMTRGGKPLYMHRSQSLRLASGTPIPEAFVPQSAGVESRDHVHEVGSVDGIADADAASLPEQAVLLAVDNGGSDPIWFRSNVDRPSIRVVLMMACGGVQRPKPEAEVDLREMFKPALRSAAELLSGETDQASADLVIIPGDGLLGGPPCGLIIGRKELVESIGQSAIWRTVRASVAITAMMTDALETLSSGHAAVHPILSMLHTGEENLRSRAERLATRVSGDESVRTCQVASEPASLTKSGPWRIASRQLRLQHRTKSPDSWAQQLAEGVPAVLATVDGDALVIDLRWVPPSDDGALAAAILGQAAGGAGEEHADGTAGDSKMET
jgi:L-seryl-tRNA(Ser) seleniumtransferase